MIRETKEPGDWLKAFWDLNERYPDYISCLRFDGASQPVYAMDEAREIFRKKLQIDIEKAMKSLTEKIEITQEDGLDTTDLFSLRKKFRLYKDLDLSGCTTVDELENLFPSDLKEFLLKI